MANKPRLYEGSSIRKYQPGRDASGLAKDSVLYRDILRFKEFSADYIALHPQYPDVLTDIRYSIQPDGLPPLWGIEMDFSRPEQHARFRVYRSLTKTRRERFFAMLMGRDVGAAD
jgi:inner membrane protein